MLIWLVAIQTSLNIQSKSWTDVWCKLTQLEQSKCMINVVQPWTRPPQSSGPFEPFSWYHERHDSLEHSSRSQGNIQDQLGKLCPRLQDKSMAILVPVRNWSCSWATCAGEIKANNNLWACFPFGSLASYSNTDKTKRHKVNIWSFSHSLTLKSNLVFLQLLELPAKNPNRRTSYAYLHTERSQHACGFKPRTLFFFFWYAWNCFCQNKSSNDDFPPYQLLSLSCSLLHCVHWFGNFYSTSAEITWCDKHN